MELKERILETSLNAFYQNGIKTITMDEIASRMGISKRTIYENFKDKEELLIEALRYREEKSREFTKSILSDKGNVLEMMLTAFKQHMEDIIHINNRFFEDIKKYHLNAAQYIEEIKQKNYEDSIAFFELGKKQGVFREDINMDIIGTLIREQATLLMNTKSLTSKYTFVEILETVLYTFMRGISTIKGHQIIDDFIQQNKK